MGRIDNLGHCNKAVIEVKMPHRCFAVPFSAAKACGHLFCRFSFLAFLRPLPRTKECKLELKVRYDNGYQTISLDDAATEELWMALSVEDEDLGKDEKSIQDAFEKQFNRPDYNNWHTFRRHTGYSREEGDNGELSRIRVFHESSVFNVEEEVETEECYAEICRQIRECLKPEWAELFIAVNINDETIRDYADRIGGSENNLTRKLQRAEKKLKKILSKRQI